MNPAHEARIVRTLAKFIANEQVMVARWRVAGQVATHAGACLWVGAIFAFFQDAGVSWGIAAICAIGGVCIGPGLWFSNRQGREGK